MAGNFFDRLGSIFGRRDQSAEEAVPTDSTGQVATEPAAPTPPDVAPEPVAESAPVTGATVPSVAPAAEPAAAPAPEVAAEPVKSAEELMEERLWAETHEAWAQGDFRTVTDRLDALKVLQPEDAAEIEEKIASAQYNYAAQIEQGGDLQRALYLYQEAQRRNPNLGEAAFAIERVQAALNPPAAAPAEQAWQVPAERTYTVESGDTLSAIAERYYGTQTEWPKIFEANRDQIDNPDLIQPGQVLRVP
jgi:nucleoid-associated protein YgaU